jgi:hypothetical protein
VIGAERRAIGAALVAASVALSACGGAGDTPGTVAARAASGGLPAVTSRLHAVRLRVPVRALAELRAPGGATPPMVRPPGRSFARPRSRRSLHAAHWTLVARTRDTRYILISFADGACDFLASVRIEPLRGAVAIVPALSRSTGTTPCALALRLQYLVVDLGEPLGRRELLDP